MNLLNQQIILSGILLYVGNALKNIPMQLLKLIQSRLGTTIISDSFQYDAFGNLNKWIVNLNKKVIDNHAKLITDWDRLNQCDIVYKTVGYGTFTIIVKSTLMIVTKNRLKTDGERVNNDNEEISIFMIGLNAKLLKNQIVDYMNRVDKEKDVPYIYIKKTGTDNYGSFTIAKRSFDTIFCDNKKDVLRHLDNFKRNINIYRKHNLTYKTGILLYGPPGTGKSSMAKVIASYMNYTVAKISLTDSKPVDLRTKLENIVSRKTVLLFEDIDCVMAINREKTATDSVIENEKKSKLEILLNFLDGIDSPDDVIFVATTNHIEDLDPALIRDGRFDLRLEMNNISQDLAIDMCNSFDVNHKEVLEDETFPISPSYLQNKILNKII